MNGPSDLAPGWLRKADSDLGAAAQAPGGNWRGTES